MSTRRPRYRYIAFRIDGPRAFRRDEVLEALRTTPLRLRLVDFIDASGLVRTTHLEKDAAIQAVNGIGVIGGERVLVKTVGTSGTIRAATRKYLSRTHSASREPGKNPYK